MNRITFVCRGFINSAFGTVVIRVIAIFLTAAFIVGLSFALGITVSVARDKWDVPANATYSSGCNQKHIDSCGINGLLYLLCVLFVACVISCIVYGVVKCIRLSRRYKPEVPTVNIDA
jgi:hypothetical protein